MIIADRIHRFFKKLRFGAISFANPVPFAVRNHGGEQKTEPEPPCFRGFPGLFGPLVPLCCLSHRFQVEG